MLTMRNTSSNISIKCQFSGISTRTREEGEYLWTYSVAADLMVSKLKCSQLPLHWQTANWLLCGSCLCSWSVAGLRALHSRFRWRSGVAVVGARVGKYLSVTRAPRTHGENQRFLEKDRVVHDEQALLSCLGVQGPLF